MNKTFELNDYWHGKGNVFCLYKGMGNICKKQGE